MRIYVIIELQCYVNKFKGGFKMDTKEKLNEEKKVGRLDRLFNLIKDNKIKTLILLIVGITTAVVSYNVFSPPDHVYKHIEVEEKMQKVGQEKYTAPMINPLEEKKRFYETAKELYAELDLQISAEQQFLTKRELHSLGDLAIESKYWFDKGENLQRKFTPENLTSFLEYDKENWNELNQELKNAGLIESPEWKLLKRGHENLIRDIEYLNEVAKRILIEE